MGFYNNVIYIRSVHLSRTKFNNNLNLSSRVNACEMKSNKKNTL